MFHLEARFLIGMLHPTLILPMQQTDSNIIRRISSTRDISRSFFFRSPLQSDISYATWLHH
jgi:hypothetical protein